MFFPFFPFSWDAYGIEASGWSLAELLHWFWWQIYRKAKWWQNDSKMRSLSPIFSIMWCLWSRRPEASHLKSPSFLDLWDLFLDQKWKIQIFGKFIHGAALKNRKRQIPRLVAVATLPSIRSTMGTVTLSERPRIKIHLSSTKPQELWNQMIWQSSYESFQFQCFFLGKLDTRLRRAPTFVTMKVAPKPQVMAAAQAEFWVAPIPGSDAAPVHCWPEKNHGFCHASKNLIWNLKFTDTLIIFNKCFTVPTCSNGVFHLQDNSTSDCLHISHDNLPDIAASRCGVRLVPGPFLSPHGRRNFARSRSQTLPEVPMYRCVVDFPFRQVRKEARNVGLLQ